MLVACGTLAGLALSPKLWIASRSYPLAPLFANLPGPGHPLDLVLLAAFALAVAAVALVSRPLAAIAVAFCLGALLVCFDQSRLQPWFYQYLLMLGALACFYSSADSGRRAAALDACRLLLASIYFWSGAGKINAHFASDVLPWVAQAALQAFPRMLPIFIRWGSAAPFLEAGIGVALLFPRSRPAAIAAAIAMHGLLLLALGPLGRNDNNVVWPWNLLMIAVVMVLFARTDDLPARAILLPGGPAIRLAAAFFAVLVPAMSLAGLWDNYPGWSLYSGNKDEVNYYLTDALFDRLPEEMQDYVHEYRPELGRLNLYEWSWSELNVPVYPELRVYRRVAKVLCGYATSPGDLRMVVQRKAVWRRNPRPAIEADCQSLPIP